MNTIQTMMLKRTRVVSVVVILLLCATLLFTSLGATVAAAGVDPNGDPANTSNNGGSGSGSDSTKGSSSSSSEGITDPAAKSGGCSGSSCTIIDKYINPTIKLLSFLVGMTAVIAIIIGSIEVTMSAGDPQKSASGKNHIRNALIGIVTYIILFVGLQWLIPGGIV